MKFETHQLREQGNGIPPVWLAHKRFVAIVSRRTRFQRESALHARNEGTHSGWGAYHHHVASWSGQTLHIDQRTIGTVTQTVPVANAVNLARTANTPTHYYTTTANALTFKQPRC